MAKFDSKSFNPQAFGAYVDRIPNTRKNEIQKSQAVTSDVRLQAALSSQTGSLYARLPYYGVISAKNAQNNDGATNITADTTTTFEQGFIVASRMNAWTEKSFAQNITAGVDFMDNVAAQIADYKAELKEDIILHILNGVFSMPKEKPVNKDFLDNHVYDISGDGDGMIAANTLNKAITKAGGDNKSIFKLVFMHSVVASNLEDLKLLKYLTYTDADGITRDLTIGSWNGRTVVVTDLCPVSGDGKYTTYVLGQGAIILNDLGDAVPMEMARDAAKNGGVDTLYVRDRFGLGVAGISFEKPSSLTASASNADLENGANWVVINDENGEAISHKAIPVCKIVSLG